MPSHNIRLLAVVIFGALGMFLLIQSLPAFQRPFRVYPGNAYEECGLPADWSEKTEWVFARLMYPPSAFGRRGGRGGFRRGGFGRFGDWTMGRSSWPMPGCSRMSRR